MPRAHTVTCPRCGAPVQWGPDSRFRPFCSERCKLIDLGAWAMERYRVGTAAGDAESGEASDPKSDRR